MEMTIAEDHLLTTDYDYFEVVKLILSGKRGMKTKRKRKKDEKNMRNEEIAM